MEKATEASAPLPRREGLGWSNVSAPQALPGNRAGGGAGRAVRGAPPVLPMEGAVLYQKSIDNSSVSYRHDPSDRDVLKGYVSWGLFAVLLLALAFGPRLWARHSGYRQAQMADKIEELIVIRDELKVRKGRLEDLRRVAGLAEEMGLQETEKGSYAWFGPGPVRGESETAVAQLNLSHERAGRGRPRLRP